MIYRVIVRRGNIFIGLHMFRTSLLCFFLRKIPCCKSPLWPDWEDWELPPAVFDILAQGSESVAMSQNLCQNLSQNLRPWVRTCGHMGLFAAMSQWNQIVTWNIDAPVFKLLSTLLNQLKGNWPNYTSPPNSKCIWCNTWTALEPQSIAASWLMYLKDACIWTDT